MFGALVPRPRPALDAEPRRTWRRRVLKRTRGTAMERRHESRADRGTTFQPSRCIACRVACVERERWICPDPAHEAGRDGRRGDGGRRRAVSEAGCVRLAPHAVDPSARLSIHRVGTDAAWHAPLAAALDELHLPRLRALLEARSVESGEWFAEHAAAQLDPDSGCTSRPLLAGVDGKRAGRGLRFALAADEPRSAARRARAAARPLGGGHARAVAPHVAPAAPPLGARRKTPSCCRARAP